jgi:hypothetical protein
MAGVKITDLTPLATAASDDLLYIVDVSDTSESPQGTSKAIEVGSIRPYKVYSALLNQSGGTAPTAIVLENTLGFTPVFSKEDTGKYFITYSSGFPINKTFSFINGFIIESDGIPYSILGFEGTPSANRLKIESYNSAGNYIDGILRNTAIEIRVYN